VLGDEVCLQNYDQNIQRKETTLVDNIKVNFTEKHEVMDRLYL